MTVYEGPPLGWDAPPAFDAWLDGVLQRLAADVSAALGDNLVALLLGGGYGRGEGGIVHRDGRDRPHNDLDLFLVVRRPARLPWPVLHALSEAYGRELGVDVDFSRPLTPADLSTLPPRLMWHDLLHGHRVLVGSPDVLTARAPECVVRVPPPVEASRLLLNRGAGLLWAQRVVAGVAALPDPDFVRRNLQKAALALGDALLLDSGGYLPQTGQRSRRLAALATARPDLVTPAVRAGYDEAVRFKRRPDEVTGPADPATALGDMAHHWGAVLLALERRRLGGDWADLGAYCAWGGLREPEESGPAHWVRNLAVGIQLGRPSLRYPRERVYRRLPPLLGLTGAAVADWPGATAVLLATWQRIN